MSSERITVDADGALSAGLGARERLRAVAGNYRLVSHSPGMLLMRREVVGEEAQTAALPPSDDLELEDGRLDAGARVVLAGEILNRMTLFQMIEIIAERGFQGDLVVCGADESVLQLRIAHGALEEARSDVDEDRLGQVLVREGFLTTTQLTELLWEVTPQRRLGEVCLERRLLDRESLFACLRRQTEGIFYRALLVGDGSYVFTTPDPQRPSSALGLHLPVRPLLMQGIQRLDEMELYRGVIPGGDVVLEPRRVADDSGLEPEAAAVFAACDGQASLQVVAEGLGIEEYEITRIAYHLVKARKARVLARTGVNEAVLIEQVSAFGAVLDDIFEAIAAQGPRAPALQMLGAWVQGCGYDTVFGGRVMTDAVIELESVRRWVAGAREDNPLASFHHVAHELVSFAMFCAGSVLTREQELSLSRDVNARLSAIPAP